MKLRGSTILEMVLTAGLLSLALLLALAAWKMGVPWMNSSSTQNTPQSQLRQITEELRFAINAAHTHLDLAFSVREDQEKLTMTFSQTHRDSSYEGIQKIQYQWSKSNQLISSMRENWPLTNSATTISWEPLMRNVERMEILTENKSGQWSTNSYSSIELPREIQLRVTLSTKREHTLSRNVQPWCAMEISTP